MRIYKNEKGVTLVELLATIILFSLIALVVWRFFFQALDFNEREVTKNDLQKEANFIVSTIQQLHTKATISEITVNPDGDLVISYTNFVGTNPYTPNNVIFNNDKIIYEMTTITNPGKQMDFSLTLKSVANEKITYSTETTFSRLK